MDLARQPGRDLGAIAVELRHEVEQSEHHWQTAVGHAIRAGELLTEAKAQVEHGEWLPWLEANFPGSERTARNYMRLGRESATVADLPTVREALAVVTAPRVEEVPKVEETTVDETEPLEEVARRMVSEKNRGREVSEPLYEAEVKIQAALLCRQQAGLAALELAGQFASTEPGYAAACADLAACVLDEDSGPWEAREGEASERWQVASRELRRKHTR
jgi:CBS domain-containing protein